MRVIRVMLWWLGRAFYVYLNLVIYDHFQEINFQSNILDTSCPSSSAEGLLWVSHAKENEFIWDLVWERNKRSGGTTLRRTKTWPHCQIHLCLLFSATLVVNQFFLSQLNGLIYELGWIKATLPEFIRGWFLKETGFLLHSECLSEIEWTWEGYLVVTILNNGSVRQEGIPAGDHFIRHFPSNLNIIQIHSIKINYLLPWLTELAANVLITGGEEV